MKKISFVSYSLVAILLVNCGSNGKNPDKVVLESGFFVTHRNDTIAPMAEFCRNGGETLFVFMDGNCSSCLISCSVWNDFVRQHNSTLTGIYILKTNSLKQFNVKVEALYDENLLYVVQDDDNRFRKANPIISSEAAIIDGDGTVITQGSAWGIQSLAREYRRYLQAKR